MMATICLVLIAVSVMPMNAWSGSACYPLHADQITGRDLAAAAPSMAGLPQDVKLGYAPAPGGQRSFTASELQQLARRAGFVSEIRDSICFSWLMAPLSKHQIEEAIRKAIPNKDLHLEITDLSRFRVPEGELTFPLTGLTRGLDAPVVWKGFVSYGGGRRVDTWVRVRIAVRETHIVVSRPIKAGEIIDNSSLATVDYEGPLGNSDFLTNEADASGQCARWNLSPGTAIVKSMLVQARDVDNKQIVTVHVINGYAHLETQGIADEGGNRGAVIRVHNPKTGRMFRARIDDRGVVTVVPGGSLGLVGEDSKS